MSNQPINYPCTCGHARINHAYRKYNGCAQIDFACGVYDCDCYKFKADNLKYLENKCDNKSS